MVFPLKSCPSRPVSYTHLTFAVKAGYDRFPGQRGYPAIEEIPVFQVTDTVRAQEYVKHHFERLIGWKDR